jgi:cellulose synthase/poly-beta-1,6-N-acetylglucosamine synthase-like glycosyltransferase
VIVCAHNEENYIAKCLISLINQTIKPYKIVVVNDASTDNTSKIIKSIADKHRDIIKLVTRKRKVETLHTTEIPKTFNYGLKTVNINEYEYLAKIDADIFLFKDYFEKIIEKFNVDEKLGIVGGILINEKISSIVGANMVIRVKTWLDISDNGFMPIVDSEDAFLIFKAQMKGWRTLLLKEAKSIHMRPSRTQPLGSIIRQRIRLGRTTYRFGYHPLYFLGRLIRISLTERPYLLCIPLGFYGWIYSWLVKDKHEEEFRKWIRNYQKQKIKCLLSENFSKIINK